MTDSGVEDSDTGIVPIRSLGRQPFAGENVPGFAKHWDFALILTEAERCGYSLTRQDVFDVRMPICPAISFAVLEPFARQVVF